MPSKKVLCSPLLVHLDQTNLPILVLVRENVNPVMKMVQKKVQSTNPVKKENAIVAEIKLSVENVETPLIHSLRQIDASPIDPERKFS